MKIEVLSSNVVLENPYSFHSYFAWPSVARLHDGRLALVASGFRTAHICPFGKSVISYSCDEGKTWTLPAPVIDTPLDDRDSGITVFGEQGVIVTSFNNSIAFQREESSYEEAPIRAYRDAYLNIVEEMGTQDSFLGSTFRISLDDGVTFGELKRMPITCPHGPAAMPDGTLLYVGRKFSHNDSFEKNQTYLACYRVFADGTCEYLCDIENVDGPWVSCEPHTIRLKSGKILVHIRVQGEDDTFTIYQAESFDEGKSFSKPRRLLEKRGGAPAHLVETDGMVISVYGYRDEPYGIRAMFSKDEGKTWETDQVIVDNGTGWDIGYPCSVVRKDGSILTVYYGRPKKEAASAIIQVIWRYTNE